jgi:hypothetical protein
VENTQKRVELMPPAEVMPPVERMPPARVMRSARVMPPRVKPRRPLWALILATAGIAAAGILTLVVLRLPRKEIHVGGPVIEVQAMSGNNYNGCGGGVTVCRYSFPSNVTRGNTMVVGVALNDAPSVTVTSSGTGCRFTKWMTNAKVTYMGYLSESIFTGVASGSGPCQVTATVPANRGIGIQLGEYSGVDVSPIDAYGTMAESGNARVSFSAENATTVSGDLAVVLWCSQNINSLTATGWTATFNQNYIGALTQYHIGSGTTVTFTSTTFPGSGVSTGVLLVLKG